MADNVEEIGVSPISETTNRLWPSWRSVAELTALFAVALLIGAVNWSEIGLFDFGISIDPLWLPIIVMSVHYGLIEGLMSAALAIGVRLFFHDSGIQPGDTLISHAFRAGTEPILWIMFALVVGGLRTRQNIAAAKARQEAVLNLNRSNLLARHYDQLQARTESLERFVATQLSSPGSRKGRSNPPNVYSSSPKKCISGLFATFNLALEGANFRIYLNNGTALSRIRDNRRPEQSGNDLIHPGSPLYETTITKRLSVCAIDDEGPFPPDCNGIFASPILAREEGPAIGMLLIDSIHPSRLTAEFQEFYTQLCREVGSVLATRGFSDLLGDAEYEAPMVQAAVTAIDAADKPTLH